MTRDVRPTVDFFLLRVVFVTEIKGKCRYDSSWLNVVGRQTSASCSVLSDYVLSLVTH